MSDITMCKDAACPDRGTCYRQQAPVTPQKQVYFAVSPRDGVTCTYYWPLHDTLNRNPKETNTSV